MFVLYYPKVTRHKYRTENYFKHLKWLKNVLVSRHRWLNFYLYPFFATFYRKNDFYFGNHFSCKWNCKKMTKNTKNTFLACNFFVSRNNVLQDKLHSQITEFLRQYTGPEYRYIQGLDPAISIIQKPYHQIPPLEHSLSFIRQHNYHTYKIIHQVCVLGGGTTR